MTQRLLALAGIGKDRLQLEWLSSAEAQRFADISRKTVEVVQSLGPLDHAALQMQLAAALLTVDNEAVRWLVGKEISITAEGDVYGRSWDAAKI